ncbi:hypothetical protein ABW21_db0205206 [Orbilia brochopaga]|nr:hypothetical protein ABW21_db0205206 [Drechslerella brochopaga]
MDVEAAWLLVLGAAVEPALHTLRATALGVLNGSDAAAALADLLAGRAIRHAVGELERRRYLNGNVEFLDGERLAALDLIAIVCRLNLGRGAVVARTTAGAALELALLALVAGEIEVVVAGQVALRGI